MMSLNLHIKLVIDKARYIYEIKQMPHLAFDIDHIQPNDTLRALIVDTKHLITHGELTCSVANYKIQSCKMESLLNDLPPGRVFYRLGKVQKTQDNKQLYSLEQMINECGLNPYATMMLETDKNVLDTRISDVFSVIKLREAQNLDWAEDSIH